jgi:hypothetical protein
VTDPLAGPLDDEADDAIEQRDAALERASLRDALALEDAGELRAAARLFEYVGEHDQAAALRLEHAATTADVSARLSILREGAARNRGNTTQGRALHRTLSHTLLQEAALLDDGARRRALVIEAARSLELAQRGGEAGQIYEELGLLGRAERAYREAGDIERYEAILERLEDRERAREARRALREEVASSIAQGRRGVALELLRWHERNHGGPQASSDGANRPARTERAEQSDPELLRQLDEMERRLPRRGRVRLRWRTPEHSGETLYVGGTALRLGRGPENEVALAGASISRRHATLQATAEGGQPALALVDGGSRTGTFVDGEALEPGVPWVLGDHQQIGIGMALELDARLVHGGLLLGLTTDHWVLFAPAELPAAVAPDLALPCWLGARRPHVVLVALPDVMLELNGRAIGMGAAVELLFGDRVRLGEVEIEVVE